MSLFIYTIPLRRMLFPEMPVTDVTVTANDVISAIFHAEGNFPDCYFDQNRDRPAKRPLRVNYPAPKYSLSASDLALLQAQRRARFGLGAAMRSSLRVPFYTVELKNDGAGRQWVKGRVASMLNSTPGLDEEVTVEEQPDGGLFVTLPAWALAAPSAREWDSARYRKLYRQVWEQPVEFTKPEPNPEPEKPGPCPFCGSTRAQAVDSYRSSYVKCPDCRARGAEVLVSVMHPDPHEEAVRAWNKVKR